MTSGDRCSAQLPAAASPVDEPVRCELTVGHDGPHGVHTERVAVDWSLDEATGQLAVSATESYSDEQRRAAYADIEVDRCVFCDEPDVATAFVFLQPHGLSVAVPGRVGLCAICLSLLRTDDVDAVFDRTRGTTFDDVPENDVRVLIAAAREQLPPGRLLVGPLLRHVGTTDATVWVETDVPCEVEVRVGSTSHRERTWNVAGHHYALALIDGLEPGTSNTYEVLLDGEPAWPAPGSDRPPSRIRTFGGPGDDRTRIAFGSCRYGRASAMIGDKHFDPDSLAAYARELIGQHESTWPDAVLMLGDQVYADETSAATQRRIRARRDITRGAKDQVADFEEYTWLYLESWTDPDVRWLMSTVSSSMIFDDHDVRDDWNTSHEWREDMRRTSWWADRIAGGLASYWVYQHLGNLSPEELRKNELFEQVRTSGVDNEPALRQFAARADAEADGVKGTRWSYRRDFGRVRLVMVDSRCGRILADGRRSMVSDDEFRWIVDATEGDYDHLLIGTSLPWLLARSLHDLEAWDEVLADRREGSRKQRFGEWLRRAADLEHWASFRKSFEALGELIATIGRRGNAPATICVLSGDVHHAYVARVHFPQPISSSVYQLTCSPLHNYVPLFMRVFFRLAWSRIAAETVRLLLRPLARVPRTALVWHKLSGPHFGNELAEFVADGRAAQTVLRKSAPAGANAEFIHVARLDLAS